LSVTNDILLRGGINQLLNMISITYQILLCKIT